MSQPKYTFKSCITSIVSIVLLITCIFCLSVAFIIFGPRATPAPTKTPWPTRPPSATKTPKPTATNAPPRPTSDGYTPLAGKIFTGVKVYFGNKKAYAFQVVGVSDDCPAMPSGKGVRVRYEDNTLEWKDRGALVTGPFYARENDPAIDAREITNLSGCR